MTLRELAFKVRSKVTFVGRLGFRNNPWMCQIDCIGFPSSGWSGTRFETYIGVGETTAQAWRHLAETLRGKTVHLRSSPDRWSDTMDIPVDLVAGDAP